MDPVDYVKDVLRGALQYRSNRSTRPYLLHQLDALQSISNKSFVRQLSSNVNQLELVECLVFLVGCLQEESDKPDLTGRVIKILLNFSNDNSIRKMLLEFNLCSSLMVQIEMNQGVADDQLLIDSFQLLQQLTYGHRINYDQSFMDGLLRLLINNVISKSETLLLPSLGTLANLCRNNKLVQSAIKNMPLYKKLEKALCGVFDHDNQLVVIFSLSILSSLCLYDKRGQKIFFDSNNVSHTLQTIFTILINNLHSSVWKHTADLFSDLLRHPKMQECIERYQHLSKCLNDILCFLAINTANDCITKVFQFLISICTVSSIRKIINQRLFQPLSNRGLTPNDMTQAIRKPLTSDTEPLLCCLHWCGQEAVGGTISLLALDFLLDSMHECLCDVNSTWPIETVIPAIVSLFDKTCSGLNNQNHSTDAFKTTTKRMTKLVKLLTALSSNPTIKNMMKEMVTVPMLSLAIETHLSLNSLAYAKAMAEFSADQERDESTECVLLLLDFVLKIRKIVPDLNDYLQLVLQNPRLRDFLALGLTSSNQQLVSISISLLIYSGVQESHPDLELCETIASLNKVRRKVEPTKKSEPESGHGIKRKPESILESKENNQHSSPTNLNSVSSKSDNLSDSLFQKDDSSFQILMSKMETIIEGKKDLKTTEIIDVFEHRIHALQIREEHLNDLLEAKTMAVTQADKVIAQLRGRQVTHSVEMKKFQNLLKGAYKKHELMVTQMNDMRMSEEKLQAQFDKEMEEQSIMIETKSKENTELNDKCIELEDKISTYQQEIKSISMMKDDLQKAHEILNEQYKVSCTQSKQLDEERKTLSKHLKEKDAAVLKLTTSLEALQTKHNNTEKERTELEKEKEEMETYAEGLRSKLHSTDKECKRLMQAVKIHEEVISDKTTKLSEKSRQVCDLEAELEKHSQIVSFINTLNLKDGKK